MAAEIALHRPIPFRRKRGLGTALAAAILLTGCSMAPHYQAPAVSTPSAFKEAQAGNFQIFQIPWSGRIDPDANVYVFMHSKAPQNDGGYSNPEADKLMDDARLVVDPAQRKAIYEKLTKVLLTDLPIIYLYHRRVFIAHTKKLEGYKQMPDGLVRVIGLKLK